MSGDDLSLRLGGRHGPTIGTDDYAIYLAMQEVIRIINRLRHRGESIPDAAWRLILMHAYQRKDTQKGAARFLGISERRMSYYLDKHRVRDKTTRGHWQREQEDGDIGEG